jgi:hypothetical protein
VLEENLGALLGSAEKRLAEVQFKFWQIEGAEADRAAWSFSSWPGEKLSGSM